MIWTVLSILVCVVICGRLMFFYSGNEHYQNPGVRWLVLLTVIYAGSQVINHLHSLLQPVGFAEFAFNSILMTVVLYFDTKRSRKLNSD